MAVALYIARVTLGCYTYKVRILFRSNKPEESVAAPHERHAPGPLEVCSME